MPDDRYDFKGELRGKAVAPSRIAGLCYAQGWRGEELVKAVACSLAESQGYTRAQNTKRLRATGELVSCDVGIFQISIRAQDFPGMEEFEAMRKRLQDPEYNVERARALYVRRGWQPWVAMGMERTGVPSIAMDPNAAGKYLARATWGVMNFYRLMFGASVVPSPWIKGGKTRLARWLVRA